MRRTLSFPHMHFWIRILAFITLSAALVHAQTEQPSATKTFASVTLPLATPTVSYDLNSYFSYSGVGDTVVQLDSVKGIINVVMMSANAPKTVTNFLGYVNRGDYNNTFIHRAVANFVLQAGGYTINGNTVTPVTAQAAIGSEYTILNTRGTIAMALTTSGKDTATCQWFINLSDNSTALNRDNNGGYTAFGHIISDGLSVVDKLAAVKIYDASTYLGSDFATCPLLNGVVSASNLLIYKTVKVVPVFPSSTSTGSVVTYSAVSSNASAVTASVSANTLTVTRVGSGAATITVTASDSNSRTATATLEVAAADSAPVIDLNPISVNVAQGSTLALCSSATGYPAPTYQWYRTGTAIAGATESSLVISNVTPANVGSYHVVATNSLGSATSSDAVVSVSSTASPSIIYALSVRTPLAVGQRLIVGVNTAGARDLLFTGVGPSLPDIIPLLSRHSDPSLELYQVSSGSKIAENADWDSSLDATIKALRGSGFVLGSKDAALYRNVNGLYTAHLFGTGSGIALAEVFDGGSGYAGRLTAVSARSFSGKGDSTLIGGFVIVGDVAKTLIIRGIGPSLPSDVSGRMADPYVEIYSVNGTKLAMNDNWPQSLNATITKIFGSAMTAGSKDAAIMITLPPSIYTAHVKGVNENRG